MSQSKSNPSYAAGWRWGWGLLALLALMVLVYAYNRSFPNKPVGRNKPSPRHPWSFDLQASGAKGRKASSGRTGSMRHVPSRNLSGVSQDQSRKDLPRIVESEVPSGFTKGKNQFQSPHANVAFEMIRQGKNYFQTAISKTPRGEQRTTSRIDLVLGAGGVADDVFLSWHDDGTMRELPMVWLYPLNSWSTSHFDPNSGGDYSRALTIRCFECHNTWAKHVPGTLNQYEREGHLLGVTCESCHGPAAPHVDYHLQNPNTKTAMHVVRPSKLERERQIEVCTQCHSNAMKHLGTAFQFRPGNVLSDHYKTIETTANEEDRVANQITYLRQSKCFQNSEMTCTTCHNPHQPKSAVSSGSVHCAKCHQPSDCKDAVHLPELVRTDCVSCICRAISRSTSTSRRSKTISFHPYAASSIASLFTHRLDTKRFGSTSRVKAMKRAKRRRRNIRNGWSTTINKSPSSATRSTVSLRPSPRGERSFVSKIMRSIEALASCCGTSDTVGGLCHHRAQRQLLDNDVAGAMATFESILATKPNDSKTHGRLGTEYANSATTKRLSSI